MHWAAGSADNPRYVLARKKSANNSWNVYAEVMKMSFRSLKKFHHYLGDRSKKISTQLSKDTEIKGMGWEKLRLRVRGYTASGPLDSQDQILAVNVMDLHAKLNDGKSGLDKNWGKRELYARFNKLNDAEPMFIHSRRAVGTFHMIRLPG